MPVLPDPNQLARATPSAQTGIVRVDTSQAAETLEHTGRALGAVSRRALVFADQTAELHAQDALIELKRRQNQMTVGENGYARLRNGAATEPDVIPRYKDEHQAQVNDIASRLDSTSRRKFERQAKEMGNQFQAGLLTHIMREDLNHRGEVYKANIAVAAETMGLNHRNAAVLVRERSAIDSTVAKYVADNGIKDEALIERMLQESRGLGHKAVIEAFVENGEAQNAEAYYQAVKQEMLPEVAKSVFNMLKPEVANQMGRDISDKLYQMHVEGRPESEIFEEKLRLTQGRGVEVLRATDAIYEDRVRALQQDRTRLSGQILIDTWSGRAGMGDPRLREIDANDPMLGVSLRQKMFAIQKRNAAEASGGRAGQTAKVPTSVAMGAYAELSAMIHAGEHPEDVIRGEILKHADVLPKAEVKQLLNMQQTVKKEAGRARIPTALINASMPKSANNTERKNAYKGFVEKKLQEWKEANPGRIPTPQDQQAILSSASEEHVEVNKFWFFNSTTEAFRLGEGARSYPKSFGQLLPGRSDEDILEAYSFAQAFKARIPKGVRTPTDAELIVRWEKSKNIE